MTVDLGEFEALGRPVNQSGKCKLGRLADELSEADRASLAAACEASHISNGTIVKWFRTRKLLLSDKTVDQHRKGGCICVR